MLRRFAVRAHDARPARRRAVTLGVVGTSLVLAATLGHLPSAPAAPVAPPAAPAAPVAPQAETPALGAPVASWDGASLTAHRGHLTARIEVPQGTRLLGVALDNAVPASIPRGCVASTVRDLHSYIDRSRLACELRAGVTTVVLTTLVLGADGQRIGGRVAVAGEHDTAEPNPEPTDGATTVLPPRLILGGPAAARPDLRLVSSPDFLNADVADLRRGPGRWTPARSTNGTNPAYRRALAAILDDWRALDPDAVLVAGDLVNGRWGFDQHHTGTFGPVRTLAQKREALRRAARTYYPQWQARFDRRDLAVFPAIGDHELGDNPFGVLKRRLAVTARAEFARQFSTNRDGSPRYADHPRGPAARTAFAARPTPRVQVISLDVFDVRPGGVRIRLDPRQLRWVERVLQRARRDGVEWTIVQGHTPIIFPVRGRASSRLHYQGGTESALWRLMRRYDVDLYLTGEVHDTQLASRDGVVQLSHGGAMQFGLTTAAVLDVHGDRLDVALRDYDVRTGQRPRDRRLWETKRDGLEPRVSTARRPLTIGTVSLSADGLAEPSGILRPAPR